MTPILFEKNTTNFTTQGIGPLVDALYCVVREKRNGLYELEMRYPMSGIRYSELRISRIIYAVPQYKKDPEPFRIYAISKPLNGVVTVNAEHISYQLSFIPVKPFTATDAGQALGLIKANSMEDNPFTFSTDLPTVARMHFDAPASARSLLGGTKGSILDVFGGEYEFCGYNVILHNHRGLNRGVEIRYGKNLVDLEQEESIENTITGIVPIWTSEDRTVYYPSSVDSPTAQNFPFKRTIVKDFSQDFENEPTLDQLRVRAESYINQTGIGIPTVSLKVEFVHLAEFSGYEYLAPLEQVNLCDTVKVVFEELGIDVTAKVVETVFDVLKNQYESVSIGSERPNLSKTIAEIQESAQGVVEEAKSAAEKAVEYVTEILTGSKGGYKKDVFDADGKPQYTLYMDTEDEHTATKVLKISKDGIGFSNNGINGPFKTAWLLDGTFIADNITAGTLSSPSGLFELDMVTGKVKMKDAEITGGSINIETASEFFDEIKLYCAEWESAISPLQLKLENSSTGKRAQVQAGGMFFSADTDGEKQHLIDLATYDNRNSYLQLYTPDGEVGFRAASDTGLSCHQHSVSEKQIVTVSNSYANGNSFTVPTNGWYFFDATFSDAGGYAANYILFDVSGYFQSVLSSNSGGAVWGSGSRHHCTGLMYCAKDTVLTPRAFVRSGGHRINVSMYATRIG